MDRDTVIVVISILILIAFQTYSAISTGNPNNLIFTIPLISILTVFLLFIYIVSKAEKRINQSLASRLPEIQYLENKEEVDRELEKLAETAEDFIVATGSKSHNKKYLNIIEKKVSMGEISYWRLLLDDKITHELCEHIQKLIKTPNVTIGIVTDKGYGNLLVVDDGALIALPIPGQGGLMGIKIPNKTTSSRLFRYLMTLFPEARIINNIDDVLMICEKCKEINKSSE
jgi:hypothetical protein